MSRHSDMKAFPVSWSDEMDFHGGMTLRTYIAVRAMQSLIQVNSNKSYCFEEERYDLAVSSYQIADAMIEEGSI